MERRFSQLEQHYNEHLPADDDREKETFGDIPVDSKKKKKKREKETVAIDLRASKSQRARRR